MIAATSHYPNFGLTIIKNENLHITYRHPTYNKKQPSGHFHHDALSITLSINGDPILIDPGSYLYTANPKWRNFMQREASHNGIYKKEKVNQPKDLFQNQIKEQKDTAKIKALDNKITIENHYLTQNRKITLEKNILTIEDNVSLNTNWNLLFAPKLRIIPHKNYTFFINRKKLTLATLESTIDFRPEIGFFSESYGKIEKCIKLVGNNYNSKTICHKTLIKLQY